MASFKLHNTVVHLLVIHFRPGTVSLSLYPPTLKVDKLCRMTQWMFPCLDVALTAHVRETVVVAGGDAQKAMSLAHTQR
jgi:hypothetical protein